MSVVSYIIESLRETGNITVPGFGEFFLKNSRAVVDEQAKSILPPAKEIGFNIDYQAENARLPQYISQNSGFELPQAQAEIDKLTSYWKKQLAENNELFVEGLGNFYQNDDSIRFIGARMENSTPDFYGLEQINLQNLKQVNADLSETSYQYNKSILWVFLLILPVLGLLLLAFTQRERLFGKKSFDDISVKNSTHRIKTDSAKIKQTQLQREIADSIRQDSMRRDSLAKAVPIYKKPVKRYSTKKYSSKKWRKPRKRANR